MGLGNPGAEYAKTRHNVGAWLIDSVATQQDQSLRREKKFFGLSAKISVDTQACWLLEPTTYMNESGKSVAAIAQFYKITPQEILIAHDELDFPAGTARIKENGGHGGHNGLRDIIQCLGSNDFYRLRIGIGHPGHKDRVTPYVLGEPSHGDQALIVNTIDRVIHFLPDLMAGDIQKVMRELHE